MPLTLAKAAPDDSINRAADKMSGRLKRAFLNAVRLLKDKVAIETLIQALESGDIDTAMRILNLDEIFMEVLNSHPENTESFKQALADTYAAGAAEAAKILPTGITVIPSFTTTNPEAVKHLETYSFNLIRQISDTTREAIRDVVTDAFKQGGHPAEQARRIKQFIGLTPHQAKAVMNYRKALSNKSSFGTALQRSMRDGRFDPSLRRAMRNNTGLSRTQIDKMTARYQDRFIAHRAETIARTESIRASNAGQHSLWQTAQRRGHLNPDTKRTWITSGDAATCIVCRGLDGKEVGLQEEFDPGIMHPPDPHPSCRCSVALVI